MIRRPHARSITAGNYFFDKASRTFAAYGYERRHRMWELAQCNKASTICQSPDRRRQRLNQYS
jgi:hypothetical protein